MRLQRYITEGQSLQDIISRISHFNPRQLQDFLRDKFNKAFGTNYRYLEDIYDEKIKPLRESTTLNEDLGHWWNIVSTEGFGALSFYPALNVWLEIDKLLRGQDINMRVVIVYSMLWVLLISGKYVKGWMDWKKQNPEEYEKERQQGKGGIV
jgi:hypothetical protein